jgi:hypothetical protein
MRILCDRKDVMEDLVYALYADMIRSACIDQASIAGQYHEQDTRLFHLPKHLAAKHPFPLSVGFKHHKLSVSPVRAWSSTSIGSAYIGRYLLPP